MKQSFILGGLLGFALCFLSALTAGSDADTALLEAVVCGLVAAMLFRWLHHVMDKQLSATEREREAAELAAASAATTAPASGQPAATA